MSETLVIDGYPHQSIITPRGVKILVIGGDSNGKRKCQNLVLERECDIAIGYEVLNPAIRSCHIQIYGFSEAVEELRGTQQLTDCIQDLEEIEGFKSNGSGWRMPEKGQNTIHYDGRSHFNFASLTFLHAEGCYQERDALWDTVVKMGEALARAFDPPLHA